MKNLDKYWKNPLNRTGVNQSASEQIIKSAICILKGAVMQIEKALINDCLRV